MTIRLHRPRLVICLLVLFATTDLRAEDAAAANPLAVAAPTIAWQDAARFVGEQVEVVGRIEHAGKSRTGHVFLNFARQYRGTLTLFIDRKVVDAFPESPDKLYRGKLLKVTGRVYLHQGGPNIALKSPDQIQLLPDDTPLPAASSRPAGIADVPVGDTLTIAGYNVLNLFDAYDDPYRDDGAGEAKPPAELVALAMSIHAVNADVLALAEVENRGVLERFNRNALADLGYKDVVLFEGNDNRGIDVAVLSRVPVGPVTSHRHLRLLDTNGDPTQFQRDLLKVRLLPPGGEPFDLFVVHFKSKGGDEDAGLPIRQAEADAARKVFDELLKADPNAAFLVCGDFNDTLDSEPLKTLVGSGPTALTTFVKDLPADNRVTYNQKPYLSMIDFILASPAMAARYVPASCTILPGSPQTTGSDHNPVVARFKAR